MTVELPDIAELVPHQLPMRLIERLEKVTAQKAIASLTIREDSLFYAEEAGGVPVHIGIEYMAQTIAAFGGMQSYQQHEAARPGFLVGSRNYVAQQPYFPLGATLIIEVEQLLTDESGFSVFECAIYVESAAGAESPQFYAKAKVNVFVPNAEPEK